MAKSSRALPKFQRTKKSAKTKKLATTRRADARTRKIVSLLRQLNAAGASGSLTRRGKDLRGLKKASRLAKDTLKNIELVSSCPLTFKASWPLRIEAIS